MTCVNAALKARNVPAVRSVPPTASGKITSRATSGSAAYTTLTWTAARSARRPDAPGTNRAHTENALASAPATRSLRDAVEHLEHEANLVTTDRVGLAAVADLNHEHDQTE